MPHIISISDKTFYVVSLIKKQITPKGIMYHTKTQFGIQCRENLEACWVSCFIVPELL